MRIGTNHGSLSDRIMSRYGDTAMGMVESAMEFLRIARAEDYHNIILSMKSSNPQVMVQAYRLLIQMMDAEFHELYPLHLGVTEAGDGEDGRIKSAIGIGTLLEDGIGDTIRVSLTEDPEFEIPVCKDLVQRYRIRVENADQIPPIQQALPYSPFEYRRRPSSDVLHIGAKHVLVVVADFSRSETLLPQDFEPIGYQYDEGTDKWTIRDAAADLIYVGSKRIDFPLPGTLRVICDHTTWKEMPGNSEYLPLLQAKDLADDVQLSPVANFIHADCNDPETTAKLIPLLAGMSNIILCLSSSASHSMASVRRVIIELMNQSVQCPIILAVESSHATIDEQLIHFSTEAGALFLDGMGDGIWLKNDPSRIVNNKVSGRTYLQASNNQQFINNTSFSILQATRTRISKTEYISCPSCGRTLFDLQETTSKIRSVTNHLKGVKIAIMGCIVNGPGEMADADFGYVGSGPGKITLYKGKEVVKRSVSSDIAVEELIKLIKDDGAWVEKTV